MIIINHDKIRRTNNHYFFWGGFHKVIVNEIHPLRIYVHEHSIIIIFRCLIFDVADHHFDHKTSLPSIIYGYEYDSGGNFSFSVDTSF